MDSSALKNVIFKPYVLQYDGSNDKVKDKVWFSSMSFF